MDGVTKLKKAKGGAGLGKIENQELDCCIVFLGLLWQSNTNWVA